MKKDQIKKLVSFFYEVGNLRKILRMHQQTLLTFDPTDNIASHTLRTAFIGYFLAKQLKVDADKVLKMCLLHDIEEVRCGDQNWIHRKYVRVFEEEIRDGQLKKLSGAGELLKLSKEYQKRKTLESKIAKDADLLDEIFLLREFAHQGNKEAARWLKIDNDEKSAQEKKMTTKLAKEIAIEAKKLEPNIWWNNLWTSERR